MNTSVFTQIYKYSLTSLFFWLYLLRGFIIYGLLPAAYAVLRAVQDIEAGNDEKENGEEIAISQLFKQYYNEYKHLKFASFMFTNLLILLFAGLYVVNLNEGPYSLFLSIVLIYGLGLTLIVLSYCTYLLTHLKEAVFSQLLIRSFILGIKNIISSIGLLVILGLLYYIGTLNLILFLVTFPFAYAYAVKTLLQQVKIY